MLSGKSGRIFAGFSLRVLSAAILFAAWCLSAAAPCPAQIAWTWEIVSVDVDSGNPMTADLTLGIRADGAGQEGRLGNHNVRGSFSGDLYDFGEGHDPSIGSSLLSNCTMTLTDGPGPFSFQVNASYEGLEGEGAEVDTAALSTVVLRFSVRTPNGHSAFVFDPLDQTCWDDNAFRVPVSYDTSGGNVILRPPDTGIRPSSVQPKMFALEPCFPNPFNPETSFQYRIQESGLVSLDVFDIRGQRICTLFKGRLDSGRYEAVWDGRDEIGRPVSSGVYLVRLCSGNARRIERAIVLR